MIRPDLIKKTMAQKNIYQSIFSSKSLASCSLLLALIVHLVVLPWIHGIGLGSSLGQRNGGVPTWVDLAGIGPRDQTQGI